MEKSISKILFPLLIIIFIVVVAFAYFANKNSTEQAMQEEDNSALMEDKNSDSMIDNGENTDSMENLVVFNVSGTDFSFDVKEINVKLDNKVRINFTSESGFHDWTIDEFNAQTEQVNTGGATFTEFTADQVGEFEYYCSVGQHRAMGMVGKLIVTE